MLRLTKIPLLAVWGTLAYADWMVGAVDNTKLMSRKVEYAWLLGIKANVNFFFDKNSGIIGCQAGAFTD